MVSFLSFLFELTAFEMLDFIPLCFCDKSCWIKRVAYDQYDTITTIMNTYYPSSFPCISKRLFFFSVLHNAHCARACKYLMLERNLLTKLLFLGFTYLEKENF